MRYACLPAWLALVVVLASAVRADEAAPAAAAPESIPYNRVIRPILADNCFQCHGPDSAARKADLRLDRREAAVDSGAIAPGKIDESELVNRILSDDPDVMMPPPSTHKTLSAAQKDLLKRWISAGAAYEPHWSFIPPTRPSPPAVSDPSWPRNSIDRFILARLDAEGLKPAAEADRRTLARRLSLDLTGLPPEPAEVEAFVADTAPDAYERLVDHFLASSRWGEHRGRYWLDAARYADTHGIHFDNFREMWTYRDWVIAALNRNMPFDRFTIEQLAGDLLPDRTLEQQIASGFNRCNMTTNEGGVIAEEYLVLYTRDRTETVSQVWLGMTANCAVCHDHKFDPLTQREFYEMAAFFNNTTQGAMDGNIKDTPPIVLVPAKDDRPMWQDLGGQLAAATSQLDARRGAARGEFDTWMTQDPKAVVASRLTTDKLAFHAPLGESEGAKVTVWVDGQPREISVAGDPDWVDGVTAAKALKTRAQTVMEVEGVGDFEKDQPFTCSVWVKVPGKNMTGAIVARMDDGADYRGWDLWLEKGRLATHVIHKWPDDAIKVIGKNQLEPNKWHAVTVSFEPGTDAGGLKLYVDGALQAVEVAANSLKNSIRNSVPFKLAQRNTGSRVDNLALQDLRIYSRALAAAEIEQLAGSARAAFLVGKAAENRSPAELDELFTWWLKNLDAPFQQLAAAKASLESREAEIKTRATIAHVMQEKNEMPGAFVLFRGEYDKRRDPVTADTPDVLPPFPDGTPRNRLGFAQWLLRPEHPLTARVTVNRFWQEVFGTGLVKTAGEFGVGGELPSHPELLDWLAVDFRENGWDIKRFFRQLVTSATYRQSAAVTPEKLEKDPQNRLLSRGPRFRMDAEMVRDGALAMSGLLAGKIGGPSVRPYQPEGVWEAVAMIGSNTRDYKQDAGDNLYRRSLYTFWKRAAPPASMEIFNAPSRETCTVRRERTNTPLQALATLNDPQFVEAARRLAERTLAEGGASDETRLDFMARRILSRPLSGEERALVEQSRSQLTGYYAAHADDAKALVSVGESKADASLDVATLAGWTMLANELMNLDEVLNK